MEDFRTLWFDFKKEFVAQIKRQRDNGFKEAWTGPANRTKFYIEKIFPDVANNMGLKITTELFKVDVILAKKQQPDSWAIPVIFVELENSIFTTEKEVDKLCSLSAPVRVLFTIGDINDPDTKKEIINWSSLIEAYYKIWPNRGILGIIIADYKFNFYSMAWNENGEQFEKDNPIFRNDTK